MKHKILMDCNPLIGFTSNNNHWMWLVESETKIVSDDKKRYGYKSYRLDYSKNYYILLNDVDNFYDASVFPIKTKNGNSSTKGIAIQKFLKATKYLGKQVKIKRNEDGKNS